ncbi:hypothetical protein TWF694_007340 [Orbilia ellipsospora]|uniref:F-box domain-containing protein n=1 Tax=Orbilia ellipsospora TaxID=2528407 RepID=A0AAV9XP51_9PEZI
MASLATLPVEMQLEIASLLTPPDIRSLSGCSKRLRQVLFSSAFEFVKVSLRSLKELRDNTRFHHICGAVRRLCFFHHKNWHASEYKYVSELGRFINVTTLEINYILETMNWFNRDSKNDMIIVERRKFLAVFSALKACSFFNNVKHLELNSYTLGDEWIEQTDWKQELTETEILGPSIEDIGSYWSNTLEFTPETAVIDFTAEQSFSIDVLPLKTSNEKPSTKYSFSNATAASLKRLRLITGNWLFLSSRWGSMGQPRSPFTTYENMIDLDVTIKDFCGWELTAICDRCWNLERLRISKSDPSPELSYREETLHQIAIEMKNLRWISLPAGIVRPDEEISVDKLQKVVEWWARNGLGILEAAEFRQSVFHSEDLVAGWKISQGTLTRVYEDIHPPRLIPGCIPIRENIGGILGSKPDPILPIIPIDQTENLEW